MSARQAQRRTRHHLARFGSPFACALISKRKQQPEISSRYCASQEGIYPGAPRSGSATVAGTAIKRARPDVLHNLLCLLCCTKTWLSSLPYSSGVVVSYIDALQKHGVNTADIPVMCVFALCCSSSLSGTSLFPGPCKSDIVLSEFDVCDSRGSRQASQQQVTCDTMAVCSYDNVRTRK